MDMIMTRTSIILVLAGAMLLGLVSAATAATGEFDNMCAEGISRSEKVA